MLDHLSNLSEGDILYIDNFVITGSDIYNSEGFEKFNLGSLNGQGGWLAGNETTSVPEPFTPLLLGASLFGLAWMRRQFQK